MLWRCDVPPSFIYLYSLCALFKPFLVGIVGEQWHETMADCGVVIVEPLALRFVEEREVDGAEVYWAEREGLEGEERAETGGHGGNGEQGVFNAHAETSRHVDARFVGDGHAGMERHHGAAAEVLANLLRTFVNAQAMAHAVACAVSEVVASLPHGIAGGKVELYAS